ncbi:MAG: hypothetical protein ACREJ0_04260, partial [Geminicoccaceae bacterium]
LKRIHSHICAIAYPILDEAGQLHRSRLKRFDRRAMAEEQGEDAAGAQPASAAATPESEPAAAPEAAEKALDASPKRRAAVS